MINDKKRKRLQPITTTFVDHSSRSGYSWQVALQQSLLPLYLICKDGKQKKDKKSKLRKISWDASIFST
jgi:hypothetical protein